MNLQSTQPVPITKPPSVSPMSNIEQINNCKATYKSKRYENPQKPIHTEPSSKSPFQFPQTQQSARYQIKPENTVFSNILSDRQTPNGQQQNERYYLGGQGSPPANNLSTSNQVIQNKSVGVIVFQGENRSSQQAKEFTFSQHNDKKQKTPQGSILDEGSVLVQKLPTNKFVKASGVSQKPVKTVEQPEQFFIKNKDTGHMIDIREYDKLLFYQEKPQQQFGNSQQQNQQFHAKKEEFGGTQNFSSKREQNQALLQLCKGNQTEKCLESFQKQKGSERPDINTRDCDGNTLLHIAVCNGNLQLVSFFLYHEAIIDALNKHQQTPLMLACSQGLEEIMQRLLTAGADINFCDYKQNTALHQASMNNQIKIVEFMLKKQSLEINKKNKDGKTAYDVCSSGEIRKVFEVFFQSIQVNKQSQNKIRIHNVVVVDNKSSIVTNDTSSDEKIGPSSFIVHGQIGKGSFGEVYLVEKKVVGNVFAMKVLHKSKIMKQNLTKYAVTERNVLSVTRHPFIVRLRYAFQTIDKLFLILDYCPGGDLGEHLQREKRFTEERVKLYLTQLILALEDLHKRDIIFRDLKPDNIVLDADGNAMLTDFGLSKEGVLEHHTGARSFCGSVAYLAPEMLKRCGHGKAVDWYLLGVVMYELLVGIPPYYANNRDELFNNIEKGPLKIPSYISTEGKNLLKALLQRNPAKRLGSGRGDAGEIKQHKYFDDTNWDDVFNRRIAMQPLNRKIKINRRQDFNVFDANSFVEPDKQHVPGWSFVENQNTKLQ